MTERHKAHDGADHIWQPQGRYPWGKELDRLEYACVCGATKTVLRLIRPDDDQKGQGPPRS